MRVFIKEYCRDVTVRIYGIDGEEHTKDFFDRYFYNVKGVSMLSEAEKSEYRSEADYAIEKGEYFECLAQHIGAIQTAIDHAAVGIINGRNKDFYTIDENCCLV